MQTAQGDTQAKVCKRACFFQRTTEKTKKSFHASQKIKSADTPNLTDKYERTEKTTAANIGLAKVAVQCSADTFVVNQSLVLRINICGENRHLRQALNRYQSG